MANFMQRSFRVRTKNCKPGIEMNARRVRRETAFTLIEIIAISAAIAMFLVLILVGVQHAKREALKKQCANNLKAIGIAFRGFGVDIYPGSDSYLITISDITPRTPKRLGEAYRYFMARSNELTTLELLICPADSTRKPAKTITSKFSNANVSYLVGIDSSDFSAPLTIMAGDDNIVIVGVNPQPGLLLIPTNTLVAWSAQRHKNQGNILLGDGSVRDLTSLDLIAVLNATGFATNRLAMP
jgi:prepilin-type processing-associated H-X9-DG protein